MLDEPANFADQVAGLSAVEVERFKEGAQRLRSILDSRSTSQMRMAIVTMNCQFIVHRERIEASASLADILTLIDPSWTGLPSSVEWFLTFPAVRGGGARR